MIASWKPIRAAMVCLSVLGATTGCNKALTEDIHTEAAVDETVKFSGYKSYGWFAGVGVVNDETGKWNNGGLDIAAELKFAIARELRDRGYSPAADNPDFLIGFLVAANIDQLKSVEQRGGKVDKIEGAGNSGLVIEVIDAKTERTIWVAVALADAQTGRTNDEVKTRIDYAVKEMFKQLPHE